MTWSGNHADIRTGEDVARQLAANPPDIPGWDVVGKAEHHRGTSYVVVTYEDEDGALAFVTLGVTSVDLDERRVRPEPRERERGDDDL
jgi:hypothetical protein